MFIIRSVTIIHTFFQIYTTHRGVKTGKITRTQFGDYLRHKLESLGPTFIKVGQILSLRPDLVPIEYCMALRNLLDKTQSIPLKEVLYIMYKEFGVHPNRIFSHISKEPIGSASLAQVHKGKLKDAAEYVAIKVRKPGVEKIVKTDIFILKILNFFLYPFIKSSINSKAVIADLGQIIDKEINFTKEAGNIERFKDIFLHLSYLKVPKVYWEHTTTKVLVMEFIPGVTLNKVFHYIDTHPDESDQETITVDNISIEKKETAKKLIHITAQSVFQDGFFHADPHPANIILTYDKQIAFIDFGMVGDLLENEKILFRELVYYIVNKDEDKIIKLLIQYNKSINAGIPETSKILAVKHYLHDLLAQYASSSQKNFPITQLMYSLGGMAFKFNFPPPAFLMLITKQIFTLEGLAGYLIPDLNVIKEFKPYVYSYKTKDALKKVSQDKILKFVEESVTFGSGLPESLQSIMSAIQEKDLVALKGARMSLLPVFFILVLYLISMGFFITSFASQQLLFLIWSSIITIILLLYFTLVKKANG